MVILSVALLAVVACRPAADVAGEAGALDPGETASGDTGGADSGDTSSRETGDTDPGDTDPGDTAAADGLVGEPLDPPLAPPAFAVLDQAGEARTEAWLVGHPTVLWFFREAEGST